MYREKFIISIPLDDYSQENYHLVENDDNIHTKDYIFSKEEIKNLNSLFNLFNDKFNILIDIYEDELLPFEYLEDALKIVMENYTKCKEFDMLIDCIKYAITVKRPILFWF